MSVRAYKIITKELANQASFNLWHDDELMDFFENEQAGFLEKITDGGGTIELSVKAIRKALNNPDLWQPEDYRKKQLEEDVDGLNDNDYVEYECF